jgi:O-antigen ligase
MGPARTAQFSLIGLAVFVCGAAIRVRLDFVGEVYLLEPLVFLVALQCVIAGGLGKRFIAPVFVCFVGAGLVTLCGYLISDLVAANQPWQYLKGWGRVAFLVIDCGTLIILAAHDRRNIWWLTLGIGVGGVVALLIDGLPLDTWKLGYGEYCALVLVASAGLLPQGLGVLAIGGFGVASLFLDYRSLGAASLGAAGLLGCRWFGLQSKGSPVRRWLAIVLPAALAFGLLYAALSTTDERLIERRQLSNSGRYVGLLVAWRAISESPIIGYGSWAAEDKFARMLRDEARRFEVELNRPIDVGRSLLPHSQLLQSWVEGGLLGMSFFLVYAWGLIVALRWFVLRRGNDRLQPAGVFILVLGLWNLVASPFLGFTRIFIALAVAVIAIAYQERAGATAASRIRRMRGLPSQPVSPERGAVQLGASRRL